MKNQAEPHPLHSSHSTVAEALLSLNTLERLFLVPSEFGQCLLSARGPTRSPVLTFPAVISEM
jgi:hypothetical protein